MARMKIFIVVALLCLSAAVAGARLWYTEDFSWGTGSSSTPTGLPLTSVNASKIPLTTGSNVEAEIVSLKAQVSALQAALALKAPKDSPIFTGPVALPATTTIGTVSSTEIAALDNVTSGIQTQLNAKAANENATITGSLNVTGEITASQYNGSGTGDHYAHLGNTGDITIPATDNAGLYWFNSTLNAWRGTVNGGSIKTITVTP